MPALYIGGLATLLAVIILVAERYLMDYGEVELTINDEKTYGERVKADKGEEKQVYENYVRYTAERLELSVRKAKVLLKKNKWLNKREIKGYNITKG